MSDRYAVYILATKKRGVLYTGITSNLWQRMQQHKNRLPGGSSFVKKYAIDRLVFYENFDDVDEAIAHEKRLKKWRRNWKIQMIERMNPEWEDLSKNWHGFDLLQ